MLSNLPLSALMSFAVHSRFYMQPTLPLLLLCGVGLGVAVAAAEDAMLAVLPSWCRRTAALCLAVTEQPLAQLVAGALLVGLLLAQRWTTCDRCGAHRSELEPRPLPAAVRGPQGGRHPPVLPAAAYAWFRKRQAPLYPHIHFPNTTFAGSSTDRGSEGNAKLVTDFVRLNSEYIGYDDHWPLQQRPGLFLDMQSVSEAEIGPCGRWRGLTLLPCGASYRALRPLDLRELLHSHLASREALRQRDQLFQLADSDVFFRRYPEGSWEFAAVSVHKDASYQLGLSYLTFAIKHHANLSTVDALPLLLDRLDAAAELLQESLALFQRRGSCPRRGGTSARTRSWRTRGCRPCRRSRCATPTPSAAPPSRRCCWGTRGDCCPCPRCGSSLSGRRRRQRLSWPASPAIRTVLCSPRRPRRNEAVCHPVDFGNHQYVK